MKEKEKSSGSRTMLLSVLMSAPGPLIEGIALVQGQSATQAADFVRRTAELLALVAAFIVYRMTDGRSKKEKVRLELRSNQFVGAIMCLSGAVMFCTALFGPRGDHGNAVPGLIIALLGVVANTLFWRKYARLSRDGGSAILAVQSRLYRAKSLVDGCVSLALAAVVLLPGSAAASMLDAVGSAMVSVYLIYCGLHTLREQKRAKDSLGKNTE